MIWFYYNWSRHGNVMTPLRFFIYLSVSLFQEFFWRIRLREYVPVIIASIIAKFEQILWERFGNILKRSFKNHKKGEIAYYLHN